VNNKSNHKYRYAHLEARPKFTIINNYKIK